MIRTSYDPEADVLRVGFGPAHANYDGAEVLSVSVRAAGRYGHPVKAAAE